MKKLICIICVIAFVMSGCSNNEQIETMPEGTTDYTYGIYELTFTAKKISNNSVGNDWKITYKHNEEIIKNGYQILLSLEVFTFQTIEVEIREKDKIDDVGCGKMNVAICDGGSGKVKITITENNGRYKGNTAEWEISCSVKLVGKK